MSANRLWSSMIVGVSYGLLGGSSLLAAVMLDDPLQEGESAQQQKPLSVVVTADVADESSKAAVVAEAAESGQKLPKYRLGVVLKKVSGDLATYLGSDNGVLIDRVLDDSPAADAELRKGDLLIRAGDQTLEGPESVMEILKGMDDSENPKPLSLTLLRAGEELTVQVTPVARPETERSRKAWIFKAARGMPDKLLQLDESGIEKELQAALKKIEAGDKSIAKAMSVIRMGDPVIRFDADHFELDTIDGEMTAKLKKVIDGEEVVVTLERSGDQPAKVTVERGERRKEYYGETLKDMSDEIRAMVNPLLGGGVVKSDAGVTGLLRLAPNFKLDTKELKLEKADIDRLRAVEEAVAKATEKAAASIDRERITEMARMAAEQAEKRAREALEKTEAIQQLEQRLKRMEAEMKQLRERLEDR